jgi:hypothetical protein
MFASTGYGVSQRLQGINGGLFSEIQHPLPLRQCSRPLEVFATSTNNSVYLHLHFL